MTSRTEAVMEETLFNNIYIAVEPVVMKFLVDTFDATKEDIAIKNRDRWTMQPMMEEVGVKFMNGLLDKYFVQFLELFNAQAMESLLILVK